MDEYKQTKSLILDDEYGGDGDGVDGAAAAAAAGGGGGNDKW